MLNDNKKVKTTPQIAVEAIRYLAEDKSVERPNQKKKAKAMIHVLMDYIAIHDGHKMQIGAIMDEMDITHAELMAVEDLFPGDVIYSYFLVGAR